VIWKKAQAEAVAPVTVTRVLSYGKAEKMKDTLKKFLSQRGGYFFPMDRSKPAHHSRYSVGYSGH